MTRICQETRTPKTPHGSYCKHRRYSKKNCGVCAAPSYKLLIEEIEAKKIPNNHQIR